MKEIGDKIPADKKSSIEGALAKLKDAKSKYKEAKNTYKTAAREYNDLAKACNNFKNRSWDIYRLRKSVQIHSLISSINISR